MSRVRSRDTAPELAVRRLLSGLGVRYRLHRRDLPGTPDIYIGRLRLAVFVNGCFWHGHARCSAAGRPKTNADFWMKKIRSTITRDRRNIRQLAEMGIESVTFWTCEETAFGRMCRSIARRYRRAAL